MAKATGRSYGYNRVTSDLFQDFEFELDHSGRQWKADSIADLELQDKFIDLPKHWFFNNELKLNLTGSLKLDELRRLCKIHSDTNVEVVLSAYCAESKYRQSSSVIPDSETGEFSVSIEIGSYTVNRKLSLEISLALGQIHVPDFSPGQPVLPRSRVFDSIVTIPLTGNFSYMNIVDVDFSNLGLPEGALWTIEFRNFEFENLSEWTVLDASNVINVCVNTRNVEDFAKNSLIQVALWSDISFTAISKVMSLPNERLRLALDAILNPAVKPNDFLLWLKNQFLQAFPGCGDVIEFYINTWATDQNSVKTNLQAVKALVLKSALSQELLDVVHD